MAGSVAGRSLDDLVGVAPYLIIGLVLVPVLMRPLNAIALGDELATSLGVSARRTRALAVVAVTLLAVRNDHVFAAGKNTVAGYTDANYTLDRVEEALQEMQGK